MKNIEKYKKIVIVCTSFVFMLSIAGYINYRYNPDREKDLGQTVYVSSNADNVDIYNEKIIEKKDNKIESFRYDRDAMFSELASNYSSIINNSNSSESQVEEYQKKLSDLIEEKNKIQMIENIIKSKGIEDAIIITNANSKYNVILKTENIDESIAAQVMQLVVDQLGASPQDISIEKINT